MKLWNFRRYHKFFNYWVKIYAQLYMTLCTPWTIKFQDPPTMEFYRQECWNGLPFSPPRNLNVPGIYPFYLMSSALTGGFFTSGVPENSGERFSSVQISHIIVSNSLRPHGLHHARPPCPSQTPGVCPNSCLLSWWCHPTISSAVPFSSCLQSFPASGAFQMSQLFAWGDQSIWVSFQCPSSEHSGVISLRMDWLDLLEVQATLKSLFQHHSSKAAILWH